MGGKSGIVDQYESSGRVILYEGAVYWKITLLYLFHTIAVEYFYNYMYASFHLWIS